MVATGSIVLIVIDMILGGVVPLALVIFIKKKFGGSLKSFFIGCGVMLVFALILESIVHSVVLSSSLGETIQNSTVLYGLYGGLMAGLFEECGRFIAMRYLLKKEHGNRNNALMYGAGHGGFEMFVLLTIGMINNLLYAFLINANQTDMLMQGLDDASRTVVSDAISTLISTPTWHFAISPVERIIAITAQLALSVIVWHAATGKKSKPAVLAIAVLLHAFLDFSAVMTSKTGVNLVLVEFVVLLISIGIVYVAGIFWNKEDAEAKEDIEIKEDL